MSQTSDSLPPGELLTAKELEIRRLGPCSVPSPFLGLDKGFVEDADRILAYSDISTVEQLTATGSPLPSFAIAGPRTQIYFRPEETTCALVTCGGLCPGLNDVIRSIVLTLNHGYGVRRILGFRYGYAGLSPHGFSEPMLLDPASVEHIHMHGGTLLGSSRGPQDVGEMVDTLLNWRVRILFAIGGDGTLRGASALVEEITRRNLKIAVIGIPKTIDNDLAWIERSFGFSTAVGEARGAIAAAHAEARAAWNGIGLVKLMGRHSGFITAYATLASGDANFCLIPEVSFSLEGGFLDILHERLNARHHAVIVVAEGAGQELIEAETDGEQERDASGNLQLKEIGFFLRERIETYLKGRGMPMSIKYIDPSYMIRSLPANSMDSGFCLILGQHAVHAGMAGCTDMLIGYWNDRFTLVPMNLATGQRKQIDPQGEIWQRVLGTTGQPVRMRSAT